MRIQTELDQSALDHGEVCREKADAVRSSVTELRAVAVVLSLSDFDSEPSSLSVAKLAKSIKSLIETQDRVAVDLDEMADACDALVEQRMVEGWEELPHPIAVWLIGTLHSVLLATGLIALVFLGVHKYRKSSSGTDSHAAVATIAVMGDRYGPR